MVMIRILRENNDELKEIPVECIEGSTLLSIDEAKSLLTQEERKRTYNGKLCWWWLRSPGYEQICAAGVFYDGSVSFSGGDVYDDDGCVRPALTISNLQSSNLQVGDVFKFGGYKFKVISNKYALCEEVIGRCAFRKEWNAKDSNVYEKSDVKKFVDNWFNLSIQDIKDIANNRIPDSKLWDEMDLGF